MSKSRWLSGVLLCLAACGPGDTPQPPMQNHTATAAWCVALACGAHGSCARQATGNVCLCEAGYAGDTCEACDTAYRSDGGGECVSACPEGYQGASCDACAAGYQDNDGDGTCLPDCASLDCGQRGACVDLSGVAKCECDQGFTGELCEQCEAGLQDNDQNGTCQPTCESAGLICGMQGHCEDSSGSATCVCATGYAGPSCDQCAAEYQDNDADRLCAPNCRLANLSCGAHGSCEDSSGRAECACALGYQGGACDECAPGFQDNDQDGTCQPDCQNSGLECGAHGSCEDGSGLALCRCAPEYADEMCGSCAVGYQDHDNDGTCLPDCTSLACGAHGSCQDAVSAASCDCDLGYEGAACERCAPGYQDNDQDGICLPDCAPDGADCGGHGSCSAASGAIMCSCDTGYDGAACEQCATDYQDNDQDGSCEISCALLAQPCSSLYVCQDEVGAAQCVFDGPTSCLEIRDAQPGATDGYYTLYYQRDVTQPWDVWCHGMSLLVPQEYLPLAATDNAASRFESYGLNYPMAQTTYFRVRIDPATLKVDVTDRRFASTLHFVENMSMRQEVDYATASSCSRSPGSPGARAAEGRISLQHTPFKVNTTFAGYGSCPIVSAQNGFVGDEVTLRADGSCGGIAPVELAIHEGLSCAATGQSGAPDPNSPHDFVLRLAYAGGYTPLQTRPQSCAEIKAFGLGSVDGDYTLYVRRDASKPWTAYCHDMASAEPREYLTLPQQSGDNNKFRYGSASFADGGAGHPTANTYTRYLKVRLDPRTLKVDITDRTFKDPSSTNNDMDFATASSCSANCCGGNNPGKGVVNLLGTPFKINDSFEIQGYCSNGTAVFSSSDQVVTLSGDGQCGGVGPKLRSKGHGQCGPPLPEYNSETRYFLQLDYL